MKKALLFLIFPLVSLAQTPAPTPLDITLKNGTVLKSATVSKSDPAFVTFMHADGSMRVSMENLREEDMEKFALVYDKREAVAHIQKENEAQREDTLAKARKNIYSNLMMGMGEIHGRYLSDTGKGILVSIPKGEYGSEVVHLLGKFEALISDQMVEAKGIEVGTFEYTTVLGANNRVRQYMCDIPRLVEMVMDGSLPGYKELSQPPGSGSPITRGIGMPAIKAN